MKISNGIKIATANKPLCYKILFSRLLITVIAIIVCFLFANIVIKDLLSSVEVNNLVAYVRDVVKDFLLGSSAPAMQIEEGFKQHLDAITTYLSGMSGEIIGILFAIFGVVQIAQFFTSLCDYVIAVNVNEHMSSMRHAEFFTTLAEHIKPALTYALYCVVLLLIYNLFILSLSLFLFFLLVGKIGLYAMSIMFFILVFTDAVKFTVVGLVPAQMVCEKSSVWSAFKDSFKGLNFKIMVERFISYFTLRVIMIVATAVAGVITFGVSIIITLPLFAVAYMAVRFVDYYTIKRKKYFITYDDIVIPKELRTDGEQLLNKVDID